MYLKWKKGRQRDFFVWENILLIRARTGKHALEKARKRAKQDQFGVPVTFRGRECDLVFAGIRKVIKCQDVRKRPTDGTEITYSELVVATKAQLDALKTGKPVTIQYEE